MASAAPVMNRYQEEYLSNLEGDIRNLRQFAEPLQAEVTVRPLMAVISKIMNLDEDLSGYSEEKLKIVAQEIETCKRELASFSYDTISDLISKPDPSNVFRVLASANKFEKALRSARGRKVKMPDGKEVVISPAIIEALTRFRFSLGTPPVTPEGIETLEKIMFGGSLRDIYAFRDLLGCDRGLFDRFMGQVNQLVEQSTHYTTAAEKKDFEKKAVTFPEMAGMRGFSKTVITGTADTAERLIQEHVLSKHSNGGMPLKGVKTKDKPNAKTYKLDEDLIKDMTADKSSLFIVRVKSVSHNNFTKEILHEKWSGLIGRLVIIDDSANAKKSNSTLVYSMHPRVTDALSKSHVKDSGTPANTQMNLRLIMENFRSADLTALAATIDGKIEKLRGEKVHVKSVEEVRKKEWLLTAQHDYAALLKFRKFLTFISRMKDGDEKSIAALNKELIEASAKGSMDYFFKNLTVKGYKAVAVPQGGGRRELVHVGKYHLKKSQKKLEYFKSTKLGDLRKRLKDLQDKEGIAPGSTASESAALNRAMDQRRSPNAAIRGKDAQPNALVAQVKAAAGEALYTTEERTEDFINNALDKLDDILGINFPGIFKKTITAILKKQGIESAAKMLERGKFREAANKLRAFNGRIHRGVNAIADSALDKLEGIRNGLESNDLDLAEKMLNDIEGGSFQPALALPDLSWTVEDVMIEDDFPSKNYVRIKTKPDGQIDFATLESQLLEKKQALSAFPEIFELYCSHFLIYFNDPHNPTSQVATPESKLKLLDIASKYGLTIVSDEPYHKQVAKEIKDKHGDIPLAEFYEQNRTRFPNQITIFTALSTTKWAMGAGRRTGILMHNDSSKDADGKGFEDFVAANIDGANTMALWMDRETLSTGLLVKDVCKALEPSVIYKNPIKAIDKVLAENFCNLAELNLPIYNILIEARNDLDRLAVRGAAPGVYKQYMSDVISKLKGLRLDKQTQRDSAKRSAAAVKAIHNLSSEFPGLEKRCIKPQGPFYFCVQLDEGAQDSSLQPFLEALAAARKIDVVPLEKGYARFAFGGKVEGSKAGYDLMTLAIETDLRLLLKYWEEFKSARAILNSQKDLDPVNSALKQLFPGGEIELDRTIEEKSAYIEAARKFGGGKGGRLTNRFSATASKYLSSIEPNSPANIITIRDVDCKDIKEFIGSPAFKEIYEYLLLQVKGKIPGLEHSTNDEVVKEYGPLELIKRFTSRDFKDARKDLFEEIMIKVANLWFDPATIKILALEFDKSVSRSNRGQALHGAENKISQFLKDIIQAIVSKERESEIAYKPTFQAGYDVLRDVKGDKKLPAWMQSVIGKTEFAGETIPTDRSPSMVTPGAARVAGFDRGIFRRDGDGEEAPGPEYFRKRFTEFAETLNPKDYICKMVQIGPTRTMLVMHRSYSHYLVEELRLMPQFDASLDDLDNLKPDAISFMGIPTKAIGEDYRIGVYMEHTESEDPNIAGNVIPVSWVEANDITDYMGYLKKPLLTVANERVNALGGEAIHGAAITIAQKDGLRKTIVFKGDSGTGKSETIIAMIEQQIKGSGGAENIEYVELLAGDMLSLWQSEGKKGKPGDLYMLGTEQGDFMRLTDISDDYLERFRDLIEKASKTNVNHPTNPRATLGGLCDSEKNLRPVRVNISLSIDNFNKAPKGGAFQEEKNPENLIAGMYPRGYRREKGTSGDQPNIYASVFYSEQGNRGRLLRKHKEAFDKLLGWDLILAPNGKVKNAVLAFNDVPGKISNASIMVADLFKGKNLDYSKMNKGAMEAIQESIKSRDVKALDAFISKNLGDVKENHFYYPYLIQLKEFRQHIKDLISKPVDEVENQSYLTFASAALSAVSFNVTEIDYDPRANNFHAIIKGTDGNERDILLDRTVFDQVYNPIASTYCGNPFMDPRGMDKVLRRFAKAMKDAGVITGTLYTQLAIDGEQFNGPARAAQSIVDFIATDKRINERFTTHKNKVVASLTKKYGQAVFGQDALPKKLQAYNLYLLERQESDNVHLVDEQGRTIPIQTPYFKNEKKSGNDEEPEFEPSLITLEVTAYLKEILGNADAANVNVDEFSPDLSQYTHIQAADSREELIYQILLANGLMGLDYKEGVLREHVAEVKYAEKAADEMISQGKIKIPAAKSTQSRAA